MPRAARWLYPRSLRWRLTLALGAVLILAFVLTFYVVYRETDSRLRGEIFAENAAAWERSAWSISPRSRESVSR